MCISWTGCNVIKYLCSAAFSRYLLRQKSMCISWTRCNVIKYLYSATTSRYLLRGALWAGLYYYCGLSFVVFKDKQMTDEQVAATLWKCYWVKCQSMMVLAGLFMLAGSFFHLSNPILLIYILEFVEMKARVVSVNVTLPKVRLEPRLVLSIIA